MPFVKVKSNSGGLTYNYTISTPTSSNAKSIDPTLPTVLFLHPVYIGVDIFQMQFGDRALRRFNFVTMDMRGHGETGGNAPKDYDQDDAAADIVKFMEALQLPPCHIFALSMGTIIALQVAISYPQKVLSLFLVSVLGLEEPEDVAQGRQEIADCWIEGFKSSTVDEAALYDAVYGALQLGFNSEQSSMVTALVKRTLPQAMTNWGGKRLDVYNTLTVNFLTERKTHSPGDLSKIIAPVKLVHCMADIAYPLEYSEEFLKNLQDAGVKASLDKVEGACHFGCVTHSEQVNPLFLGFVLEYTTGPIPPMSSSVSSPFEAGLIKAGWTNDDSDDE
ncbi:alpha/beta-hydrolase [Guyanagaster necrorhizus]|uniref:Alpha/beta-hydrolase n=1 Tax=Guyanagaster necrorhizus TaxID=856835 RepID=A0A9P8AUW7_9AGAR|nr:alpha/beta-hydrolase [Guyanagaster necrorhizus MCA 3950]KAG7448491.1 alpha/beta-hydrolase [Guyanagaster necrorhizus MCA 3950]